MVLEFELTGSLLRCGPSEQYRAMDEHVGLSCHMLLCELNKLCNLAVPQCPHL